MLVVFLINEALKEYIFHNSIYVNLFKCKIQKNFCIAKLYVFCIFENVSHFEQRGIIKYSVFDIKYLLTKFKMPRWILFHAFRNVNIVLSSTQFKWNVNQQWFDNQKLNGYCNMLHDSNNLYIPITAKQSIFDYCTFTFVPKVSHSKDFYFIE